MKNPTPLKRTLTLPEMVLYGLGTTIGAGIYALVGELAGIAGYLAPAVFLFSALLAGLTAFSFAELSCRYPRAAGAALYSEKGFHSKLLTITVGLLVICAGMVSAAALINAFAGYLNQLFELDHISTIIMVALTLTGLAIYGIAASIFAASAITLVAVGGLVWIIYVGYDSSVYLPQIGPDMIPDLSLISLTVIFSGTLLAFYAFIGFEDMVDVAEEIKDVKHNLPLAIILTLAITTVLYMLIMTIAVLSMPPEELAKSDAPLATLFSFHTGQPATAISLISMLAIINGSLIQLIMASRVIYGLSSRQQLPQFLGYVNPKTQTPVIATAIAGSIILILALIGNLAGLAETTSLLMLIVFSIVNLSLWRIKRAKPTVNQCFTLPRWVALFAFIICAGLVITEFIAILL